MKQNKLILLSLLLILSVLGTSLAGCGSVSTVTAGTVSSEKSKAVEDSAVTEVESEQGKAVLSEGDQTDSIAIEDILIKTADTLSDPIEALNEDFISYPLDTDGNSISIWYYIPPYTEYVDSNYNYYAIPYAEAATGIALEFVEVSNETANEQFALMIASGDWTDLIPAYEYYTGGLTKAYEEGVIQDISPYLEDFLPNYAAVVATLDEQTQRQTLTDGLLLAFNTIADGSYVNRGPVTRGDWLEALGISFSGDRIELEEFTDVLYQLHDSYQTDYTYAVGVDGTMPLEAAFDTEFPTLGASYTANSNAAIYRTGDEIVSGWTSDGYREYVEWLIQLFHDGVLYQDFLASPDNFNSDIGVGNVAAWTGGVNAFDGLIGWADEENAKTFKVAPIPPIVKDADADYLWTQSTTLVTPTFSLSAESEKAELVCEWENYFWTYEGYQLANYGVEGETFSDSGDNDFEWLDGYVIGDTEAPNSDMALALYTMMRFASYYSDNDKLLSTLSDTALNAINLWNVDGGVDARNYPDAITFSVDETAEINEYQPDLVTYAQETILSYLYGTVELTDENWDDYVATCESLGLNEIIAIYQNAYDEYVVGER